MYLSIEDPRQHPSTRSPLFSPWPGACIPRPLHYPRAVSPHPFFPCFSPSSACLGRVAPILADINGACLFAYFANLAKDAQPKVCIGSHNAARAYVAGSTSPAGLPTRSLQLHVGRQTAVAVPKWLQDTEPGLEVDIVRCYSEISTRSRSLQMTSTAWAKPAQNVRVSFSAALHRQPAQINDRGRIIN